ncbi:MAG: O-antigen ligase family protein [Clostridia bacterium]|nr:O-antigen ligase family protein [Clostridia bacterium]
MQKVREFLTSDLFNIIMFVLAAVIICIDQMLGTPVYYGLSVLFGFLTFAVLMLTDDFISVLCPGLMLMSFVIQYKNSYDAYMHYMWGAPILGFAFLFHIFISRKKFEFKKPKDLKLFWPYVAASVAMILGGVGIMTSAEYFAKINIVNAILLGPFALLLYVVLSGVTGPGKNYTEHMDERISKVFITVAVFLIFAVFEYYAEHWSNYVSDPNILQFQWRNNACTLLMIAMPFSFYMAKKKHFAYILVAIMNCVAFVLSGSRGGLVFGAIEFLILLIYFAKKDEAHRKYYIGILSLGVVAVAAVALKFSSMFSNTFERFVSYKENFRRLGLWQRSVEDFKANPIFGRGVGYQGNRDLHPSKIGALCWYHSSLPQVWGSMGIAGILAYGYRFVSVVRTFAKRTDLFAKTVFLSFIGLELMSLVNPGIFAPAYLFIITILFVIAEQYEFDL